MALASAPMKGHLHSTCGRYGAMGPHVVRSGVCGARMPPWARWSALDEVQETQHAANSVTDRMGTRFNRGAACRNRTDDLFITSESLYRLS